MSDDWFQKMLDIHLIAPFRIIRAAAPHLREPAKQEKAEGQEVFRKIVNVSSVSGRWATPARPTTRPARTASSA
jgi:3-oxoacyl-[acyl-carrier protein] reductase